MAITIEIPTAFRRFTDGELKVSTGAATVADALTDLTTKYPALSRHVRDEQGQIRQHINIFIGNENIRYSGGLTSPVSEGAEISIVPAVSGG